MSTKSDAHSFQTLELAIYDISLVKTITKCTRFVGSGREGAGRYNIEILVASHVPWARSSLRLKFTLVKNLTC